MLPEGIWRGAAVSVNGGLNDVSMDAASMGTVSYVDQEYRSGLLESLRCRVSFWSEGSGAELTIPIHLPVSEDKASPEIGLNVTLGRAPLFGSKGDQQAQQQRGGKKNTGPSKLVALPLNRPTLVGSSEVTGLAGLAASLAVTDDALATLYSREAVLVLLQTAQANAEQAQALAPRGSSPQSLPIDVQDLVRLFRLVSASEVDFKGAGGALSRKDAAAAEAQKLAGYLAQLESHGHAGGAHAGLQQQSTANVLGAIMRRALLSESEAVERAAASGDAAAMRSMSQLGTLAGSGSVAAAGSGAAGDAMARYPVAAGFISEVVRNITGVQTGAGGSKAVESEALVLHSLHPLPPGVPYWVEARFPGASQLQLEFDSRTKTPAVTMQQGGVVTVAKKAGASEHTVRVLRGRSRHAEIAPALIDGDSVRVTQGIYFGEVKPDLWGWRVRVMPLRNLSWNQESQVVKGRSLEFGTFLLRFLCTHAPGLVATGALHSPVVIDTLTKHLLEPKRPYKAQVQDLLAQLLATPQLLPTEGPGADPTTIAGLDRLGQGLYDKLKSKIDAARKDTSGVGVPGPQLQLLQLAVMARRAATVARGSMRGEPLGASDETQSVSMQADRYKAGKHVIVGLTAWPPSHPFDQLQWLIGICTALRYRWPLPERFLASCYKMAHNKKATSAGSAGSPRDLVDAQRLMTTWTGSDDAQLVGWLRDLAKKWDCRESQLQYNRWARPTAAHRTAYPLLHRHCEPSNFKSLRLRVSVVMLLNQLLAKVLPYVDVDALAEATQDDSHQAGGSSGALGAGVESQEATPASAFEPSAVAHRVLSSAGQRGWTLAAHLGALRHFILPDCKMPYLDEALKATESKSGDRKPGKVKLHNGKALQTRDRGHVSASQSQCLFMQLGNQMRGWPDKHLRAPLDGNQKLFTVVFQTFNTRGDTVDEDGIDAGGLYREAMSQSVMNMFDPSMLNVFMPSPKPSDSLAGGSTFLVNPAATHPAAMRAFEAAGILIGVAIRNKRSQAFQFAAMVWSRLLQRQPADWMIEQVDEDYAQMEHQLRKEAQDVEGGPGTPVPGVLRHLATTELVWEARRSDGTLVQLARPPGLPTSQAAGAASGAGGPPAPTKGEVLAYCRALRALRGTENEPAYEAMRKGLGRVVPMNALRLLTAEELETAACGEKDINVDRMWDHITFINGFSKTHPVIRRLKKVLESFSPKERSLFIQFSWGRSQLPPQGAQWERNFKVGKMANTRLRNLGDRALPIAHTCFF